MSWDWKRYLEFAEALSSSTVEVDQRNAISRAYYAAFHSARLYLKHTHGQDLKGEGCHGKVRVALVKLRDEDNREIASLLSRMSIRRNNVDYDPVIKGKAASVVAETISDSKSVITLVTNLSK